MFKIILTNTFWLIMLIFGISWVLNELATLKELDRIAFGQELERRMREEREEREEEEEE